MRPLMILGLMAICSTVAGAQAPPSTAAAPAPAPAVPTVVKVGDMAPDFTLPGSDGKTHKLSEYRGKTMVVLAWFPKAFTGGCTTECKSLAENGDKIQKYQVAYFMASTDQLEDQIAFAKATSVAVQGRNGESLGRTVEKKSADFPMLADPSGASARAYGVADELDRGRARRWTFYIDKSGRVAAIDTAVRPATSAEDMIAKLVDLKVPTK
ncbi:MAG: redoxin domain-containing protein [Vicinamibacterales bacterium]